MRFFRNFPEAFNELRRELKEMGIKVKTSSVQNLDIRGREEFTTLELQNYAYTVLNPNVDEIPLKSYEWAEKEFSERISMQPLNPGEAYKLRLKTWDALRRSDGKFDYTYPERYANGLGEVIEVLQKDIHTRRAFLGVFDAFLDDPADLTTRIPCTIGYWFNFRNGKLNMTYLLRSSDFGEHYNYDMYLSTRLLNHVAEILKVPVGTFTHWIGSFHVFEKEVADAF